MKRVFRVTVLVKLPGSAARTEHIVIAAEDQNEAKKRAKTSFKKSHPSARVQIGRVREHYEIQAPDIHELPDGRRLMSPQPRPLCTLRVDQWVRVGDRPLRIADMRQTPDGRGGRIVQLDGHPPQDRPHPPLTLDPDTFLPVYTVVPVPARTPR